MLMFWLLHSLHSIQLDINQISRFFVSQGFVFVQGPLLWVGWLFFFLSSAFWCSLYTPCVPSAPFLALLIYSLLPIKKESSQRQGNHQDQFIRQRNWQCGLLKAIFLILILSLNSVCGFDEVGLIFKKGGTHANKDFLEIGSQHLYPFQVSNP